MIPEIGHFALILALCMALVQGTLPIIGAARGVPEWTALARPVARGQALFVLIAFVCLTYAFISNDFSVLYVTQHSNSQLPLQYRIAGVWGGHEGSLLLWALILSLWTLAVSLFSRHLPQDMAARVLGVMGLVAVGFYLFMLITSNPFTRLFPAAADGNDLNPLLQDPGLVIHPPMLYMGYVGFSVAFAFAIAALLSGRLDATWARWSRPWTTAAWMFLTLGIALGSWWAYYELGWGGWWFWDPVENASFMPWLVGTALIHSLAVTEKRGAFKSWTVLLAIFAFSLSLLGTFLVRSGVLVSVHAFATDPARGVFILAFLSIVVGGSLALYAWRAPRIGLGGSFELVSRETALLGNNVVLAAAAAAVLLGTIYPIVHSALDWGQLSVGPPYFELIFVPLMVVAVVLMGIGPYARWKKTRIPDIVARVRWSVVVSIVAALAFPFLLGRWSPMISLGIGLAAWIIVNIAADLWGKLARAKVGGGEGRGVLGRLRTLSRSYYGMSLAHLGVAVFIIGVTIVRGYEVERDMRMEIGDTTTLGGYTFRFDGVRDVEGPNYDATRGHLTVTRDGDQVTIMTPEKRIYTVQRQPMTEAAIDTGLFRDLYVSLGEPLEGGAWSVRLYFKPFVDWIWGGCVLMALGGMLALTDRRYRVALARQKTEAGVTDARSHPQAAPAYHRR